MKDQPNAEKNMNHHAHGLTEYLTFNTKPEKWQGKTTGQSWLSPYRDGHNIIGTRQKGRSATTITSRHNDRICEGPPASSRDVLLHKRIVEPSAPDSRRRKKNTQRIFTCSSQKHRSLCEPQSCGLSCSERRLERGVRPLLRWHRCTC